MASKLIKGITIEIGADTVGLDKALRGVETAGKKASSELKEIDRALKGNEESAVLWEQKQKVLNTALDESKKKLKLLEEAQEQVNRQFENGEISQEQYRAFQRETEKARAEVEGFEKKIAKTNDTVWELRNKSDEAAEEVEDLGDETRKAGDEAEGAANGGFSVMKGALADLTADGIRMAAGALKDFAKDVVTTGMTYEEKMSAVGAISGATAEDMERLTAKAEEMGATTKFTAGEAAEAFQYMAMAGWKTEDMLSGIDGILQLAAASGEDLGTTSDIVTDALTAFGLGAEDAGHFANILAAASSNANTNVSMMGETFKYAAPIAGSLGFTAEDTAEAIGLMANSGIKASQAGTALRSIMTQLSSDFTVTGASIGETVIQTQNADGTMRSFSEILTDTREAFAGLTDAEKANQAEALVGKNALSGFLALINSAPDDVDKLSGAIASCDGAAEDMSTTMMDNLSGDITLFESAVDGMKISLSRELTPILRETVQYVTQNMPAIKDAITPVFKFGAEVLTKIIKDLPTIIDHAKRLAPVIKSVGGAFIGISVAEKAVDTLTKKFGALSVSSELLPIEIAAIAGALVAGGLSYVAAAREAHQAHLEEVFAKATESTRELTNKVYDNITAMKDQKEAAREAIETDELEIRSIENLWKELELLTDANGNVREGYEDRVKYITDELSSATGIEIGYIDGQIQKYDELKSAIDEVIQKKRAESMSTAYDSVYHTALEQNAEAASDLVALEENLSRNQYNIDKLYRDVRKRWEDTGKSWSDFGNFTSGDILSAKSHNRDTWTTNGVMTEKEFEELAAYETNIRETKVSIKELQNTFAQNQADIEAYERATEAMYSGNYQKAQDYFSQIGDLDLAALRRSVGNISEQKKAFSSAVDDAIKEYNAALRLGDKNAKSTFAKTIQTLVEKGKEGGMSIGDIMSTGIVGKLADIDGFDDASLLEFARTSGTKWGENFGEASSEAVSRAINRLEISGESLAERISSKVSKFTKLPMFASGGILQSGRGIVAEAGPELLEIINGGVRITPLTSSARNTPVTSTGGQKVYYFNYTINAEVSSDYDVGRLAERLSAEQRRIEAGKGM